jgi:hypothetical protein
MKVKELIEQLSKIDPELPIYIASDPEGNGFHMAWEVEPKVLMLDGEPICGEDLEEYPEDDSIHEEIEKVVIIWP